MFSQTEQAAWNRLSRYVREETLNMNSKHYIRKSWIHEPKMQDHGHGVPVHLPAFADNKLYALVTAADYCHNYCRLFP